MAETRDLTLPNPEYSGYLNYFDNFELVYYKKNDDGHGISYMNKFELK